MDKHTDEQKDRWTDVRENGVHCFLLLFFLGGGRRGGLQEGERGLIFFIFVSDCPKISASIKRELNKGK